MSNLILFETDRGRVTFGCSPYRNYGKPGPDSQINRSSTSALLSMVEKLSHARSNTSGSYVGM